MSNALVFKNYLQYVVIVFVTMSFTDEINSLRLCREQKAIFKQSYDTFELS